LAVTITVPLDHVVSLLVEHPWPAVVFVFLVGVVLPAVWSTRRHRAAMAVLRIVRDIAVALRGTRR
jgi:hypothetical protein